MIELFKVLIDFGLLVLVWLVQFAIYPGFKYYSDVNLKRWHPLYSRGISYVVAPLMLAQLALSIYFLISLPTWVFTLNLVLVFATWMITFFWAVPLHAKIETVEKPYKALDQLLKVNRLRAWIWTMIFVLSCGLRVFESLA